VRLAREGPKEGRNEAVSGKSDLVKSEDTQRKKPTTKDAARGTPTIPVYREDKRDEKEEGRENDPRSSPGEKRSKTYRVERSRSQSVTKEGEGVKADREYGSRLQGPTPRENKASIKKTPS